MITDCCAGDGEFWCCFFMNGQTCEHALLAYTLCETANCWCQQSGFHGVTLKPEVSTYIKKIGHNPDTVAFVSISTWNGDSMLETSANMPWFKGWKVTHKDGGVGRATLPGALNCILPPTHRLTCLQLPPQAVSKIGGIVHMCGSFKLLDFKTSIFVCFWDYIIL